MTEEVETQVASETENPVKVTKPKAEKPKPAPVPENLVFVGPNPAREGSRYDTFRKIIAEKEGLTVSEAIQHIAANLDAKNSKQAADHPDSFIRGYLSAGTTKGFFSATQSHPYEVIAVTKAAPKVEKPLVSEAGTSLLKAVDAELAAKGGAEYPLDQGLSLAEVVEKSGMKKAIVNKVIKKLDEDKYLEKDIVNEVETIYMTEKAIEFLKTLPVVE